MSIKQETCFTTYFYNNDNELLGSFPGMLPIPLFKGMTITIHSYEGAFEVVDWNFHLGHPDEQAGVRVFLKNS